MEKKELTFGSSKSLPRAFLISRSWCTVSQPCYCWPLSSLLEREVGAVLCIVGCSTASLASIYLKLCYPTYSVATKNGLQVLIVDLWAKSPHLRITKLEGQIWVWFEKGLSHSDCCDEISSNWE